MKIMERNQDNMVLVKLFEDILSKYHKLLTNLCLLNLLKTRLTSERLEIVHGYISEHFKDVSVQAIITQVDDSIVSKPEEAVVQALNEIFKEVEVHQEADENPVFQRKIDNVLSIIFD